MTERTNLDRDLSMYFELRSTSRAPAGLLEATLRDVDRTRQRPTWTLTVRRVAERLHDRWTLPNSARLLLAVIAVLAVLLVAAFVIGGSQRRLPPPFGPARPGLLAFDTSSHIGLLNADGTGLTMLTSGPEVDRYPIWSPDGTRIAFVASRDLSLGLVVMDADGRHRITLADQVHRAGGLHASVSFGSFVPMTWSPDSQRIAFAGDFGDGPHLYVSPADRPAPERIGPADLDATAPSWSPDGTLIAFRHAEDADHPQAVWLIRPDGGGLHKLSHSPMVIDVFPGAAWAPDGKRLAFLAEGMSHSNDVYVINADGTDQRDVTFTPDDEQWASWSPDGKRLTVGWFEGASGVFVTDVGGTNRVDLPTGGNRISTPAWSPDGARIVGYRDAGLMDGIPEGINGVSDGFLVLDPTGRDRPMFIPENSLGSVTWQRLAP